MENYTLSSNLSLMNAMFFRPRPFDRSLYDRIAFGRYFSLFSRRAVTPLEDIFQLKASLKMFSHKKSDVLSITKVETL